jgi:hypothetical protein
MPSEPCIISSLLEGKSHKHLHYSTDASLPPSPLFNARPNRQQLDCSSDGFDEALGDVVAPALLLVVLIAGGRVPQNLNHLTANNLAAMLATRSQGRIM